MISGLVIVGWAIGLPTMDRVSAKVSMPLNQAIENVNNMNYSSEDKEVILAALDEKADDSMLLFTNAQILRREGQLDKAADIYKNLVDTTSSNKVLHKKSLLNLAGIYYLKRNFEKAESLLEELEGLREDSFEFYYNYAHVKLALLDTVAHRKFYKIANDLNGERINWLKKYNVAERKQVFAQMPKSSFYPALFSSKTSKTKDGEMAAPVQELRQDVIYQSLLRNGSQVSILLLGLVTLLIGAAVRFSAKPLYRMLVEAKPFFGARNSKIWHGVPAGGYLAGSHPVLGAVLLSILVAMVMASTGKPVDLLELTPMNLNFSGVMISLAAIMFLLVSASSLIFINDDSSEAA